MWYGRIWLCTVEMSSMCHMEYKNATHTSKNIHILLSYNILHTRMLCAWQMMGGKLFILIFENRSVPLPPSPPPQHFIFLSLLGFELVKSSKKKLSDLDLAISSILWQHWPILHLSLCSVLFSFLCSFY